jgi:hypothetical protein
MYKDNKLHIQLKFEHPEYISPSIIQDTLVVLFTDEAVNFIFKPISSEFEQKISKNPLLSAIKKQVEDNTLN